MTPEIKEMIELAAKAMGYELGWNKNDIPPKPFIVDGNEALYAKWWNPLTPADSHAMMCALEIDVVWNREGDFVEAWAIGVMCHSEPYTTDKSAACCLAALRVAAEIGRRK